MSATPGPDRAAADDLAELRARLDVLEAQVEIVRRIALYHEYLDRRTFPPLLALFAPTAELDFGGGRPVIGREAIEATIQVRASRVPAGVAFHLMHNPMVRVDGDSASATSMWSVLETAASGRIDVLWLGTFADTFARIDGQWLITRRTGRLLLPRTPAPAPASESGSAAIPFDSAAPASGSPSR